MSNTEDKKGVKYIGHVATLNDFQLFIAECVTQDENILENIDSFREEDSNSANPTVPQSWEIDQICTDMKNLYSINAPIHNLQAYLDNADYYNTFKLYYKDDSGKTIEVDKDKLRQVAIMWMPYYDTKYRIAVFETNDDCLWLGINNPD